MKIISIVDSFKGSLSSIEINNCVENGVKKIFSNAKIIKIPIADGGEGTVEAFINIKNGKIIKKEVHDPLMRTISSYYGVYDDTAVIEIALASGLPLLNENEKNPNITTTYGVGELILDALDKGYRKFIIGLGGSATNDAGMGMLTALGMKFYDNKGNELIGNGKNLIKISKIDDNNFDKRLKESKFIIASDVNNPFYGENGAAYIYAKQKGADNKMIIELDKGLMNFKDIVYNYNKIDIQNIKGAGAAGGLGGSFAGFFNSEIKSGIDIILELVDFDKLSKEADIIITGEGKIDHQSVMGKVISGIGKYGIKYNKPVIAIAGGLSEKFEEVNKYGVTSAFSIMNYPMSLEEAMEKERAKYLIEKNIEQIMRLIKSIKR
jgi:glycerate kinase